MKLTVDRDMTDRVYGLFNDSGLKEFNEEFISILKLITFSENEAKLRINMQITPFNYFKVGFGSSHMWVKQLVHGKTREQIIFVEF